MKNLEERIKEIIYRYYQGDGYPLISAVGDLLYLIESRDEEIKGKIEKMKIVTLFSKEDEWTGSTGWNRALDHILAILEGGK